MATGRDLEHHGFVSCEVRAKQLNIDHGDARGPFCRLVVDGDPPPRPGVYAWAENGHVMYIGKARALNQIVHGARVQRAYNDYTYVPASKLLQTSSPRVRVNGLLNAALVAGARVLWWGVESASEHNALRLEAELIAS